jgi:hypothetical protein
MTEGSVIKGKVVAIEKDDAVIDVGLKTEGRVKLKEFAGPGKDVVLKVGDEVEVYLERVENALGEAVISRDKARREESWVKLEQAFEKQEKVNGIIFNQVKGGYTVDLEGAVAFLPRSQVDIRPIRDVTPLMGVPSRSRSSRWIAAAATSSCRAAPCSKRPAPRPARNSSPTSRKARPSTASSRTSPITVRSLTSAASTACCM